MEMALRNRRYLYPPHMLLRFRLLVSDYYFPLPSLFERKRRTFVTPATSVPRRSCLYGRHQCHAKDPTALGTPLQFDGQYVSCVSPVVTKSYLRGSKKIYIYLTGTRDSHFLQRYSLVLVYVVHARFLGHPSDLPFPSGLLSP